MRGELHMRSPEDSKPDVVRPHFLSGQLLSQRFGSSSWSRALASRHADVLIRVSMCGGKISGPVVLAVLWPVKALCMFGDVEMGLDSHLCVLHAPTLCRLSSRLQKCASRLTSQSLPPSDLRTLHRCLLATCNRSCVHCCFCLV